MPRETLVHWGFWVYLEMFLAGTAAGAYVVAAIYELFGRGRSATARAAHMIAFPLMLVSGLLLVVDLNRPERFWHMLVQSERLLPMLKWWSPISVGSWGVLLFSGFAFVTFVDAVWLHRIHGSALGVIWSILGGVAAFFVGGYSGVLLTVTNMPGWMDSWLLGALFVATSGVTGIAAIVVVQAAMGSVAGVELETAIWLVSGWALVMLVGFLATTPFAVPVYLTGASLLAIVLAVVLGLLGVGLWRVARGSGPAPAELPAALVLIAGFLLRYAVVMGPQPG